MSSMDGHHIGEEIDTMHGAIGEAIGPSKKGKKKRDPSTLRKAPQAPKRFKSSYICFFMAKQPEIKAELGEDANVTSISKRSAEMWKNLPPEERAHWDDVAAKDKQRYMNEKATYTGPWQVPWKRVKKDPTAPRRPMSAFLFYSMGKRQKIKKENPEMKNTEISRVLGEMWRGLSDEERRPFVDREKSEREKYKVDMAEWRKNVEEKQEAQRKAQAEAPPAGPPDQPVYPDQYGAMPPQFMYSGYPYPYPPGPYQFPTNGKQPVILGANGMPHPSAAPSSPSGPPPGAVPPPTMQPPPPFPAVYDDGSGVMHGQHLPGHFDYSGDHVANDPGTSG